MQTAGRATSQEIRDFVRKRFVEEAKKRGERRFSVNAGEVHRAMGLRQRVPLVCTALDSDRFLKENGLKLVDKSGPPSGLSTSVTFTYEFSEPEPPSPFEAFRRMRGIAAEVFRQLGGGEEFIRKERAAFFKKEEDSQ